MTFIESIRTCLTKYADFNGRASRSEYWWFILFTCLVSIALSMVDSSGLTGTLFYLAVLLPSLGVAARRLHDTNRSGWFLLLNLIPIIGWIILIIWYLQKSQEGTNQYDTKTDS